MKCRSSGQRVDDGLWHSVSVSASNQQMTLTVDGEPPAAIQLWEQLEAEGDVNLGGLWISGSWGREPLQGKRA